ncbi:hypothetical protein [Amycolatopsis sp.]|uniref:hypothetical protein n=1 Tax=Amycolatopsis sp. TaxID=37632 RepID=UPI002C3249D4|nr:hypothetical protein [Amycolatopsis sp.]HVV14710.1 hypothetical protein [Amycolatopsis sp.]
MTNAQPVAAPGEVGTFAAHRGLGQYLDVRHEVPMTMALVKGLAIAIVCGAGAALVIWWVSTMDEFSPLRAVHWVGLALFFGCVYGIAQAVRGLIVGSRAHYLYSGGLVRKRRTGLFAVSWTEISGLSAVYNKREQGQEGKILGYRVNLAGGESYTIPLLLTSGRDRFIDQVIAFLRQYGKPVG